MISFQTVEKKKCSLGVSGRAIYRDGQRALNIFIICSTDARVFNKLMYLADICKH